MTSVLFSIALLATAMVSGPAGTGPPERGSDPYANRSGEAEALALVERGDPARIYYRSLCGDRCAFHAVALLNCEPDRFDTQQAPQGFFVPIEEASASASDYDLTAEQIARRNSAYSFARSFNLTIFRLRRDEILKSCPQAVVKE